jgi:hypothetical protein
MQGATVKIVNISRYTLKNIQNYNFTKRIQWEPSYSMQTERRVDIRNKREDSHDEANGHCPLFCESSKTRLVSLDVLFG